ncbi:MAG: hypothetical protein M3O31_15745 [Acidobacteriota bacterium]|nr:hypothetical protein [Acidobacteriota bacterium]
MAYSITSILLRVVACRADDLVIWTTDGTALDGHSRVTAVTASDEVAVAVRGLDIGDDVWGCESFSRSIGLCSDAHRCDMVVAIMMCGGLLDANDAFSGHEKPQ